MDTVEMEDSRLGIVSSPLRLAGYNNRVAATIDDSSLFTLRTISTSFALFLLTPIGVALRTNIDVPIFVARSQESLTLHFSLPGDDRSIY